MANSLEEARDEIRKMQLEQIKDFREKGWHDIADKMEKELKTNKVAILEGR